MNSWCLNNLCILESVDRWCVLPGGVERVRADHLTLLHSKAEATVHGNSILIQMEQGQKVTRHSISIFTRDSILCECWCEMTQASV